MERIAGKLRVLVSTVTSLAALTQELVKADACVIALPDAGRRRWRRRCGGRQPTRSTEQSRLLRRTPHARHAPRNSRHAIRSYNGATSGELWNSAPSTPIRAALWAVH